jgi:hypothetical protein
MASRRRTLSSTTVWYGDGELTFSHTKTSAQAAARMVGLGKVLSGKHHSRFSGKDG